MSDSNYFVYPLYTVYISYDMRYAPLFLFPRSRIFECQVQRVIPVFIPMNLYTNFQGK